MDTFLCGLLFWLFAGWLATPFVLLALVEDRFLDRICGFLDCKSEVSLSLGFFVLLVLGGPISLFFSLGGVLLIGGVCLWELNKKHCKICKIPVMTVTLPHKKELENEG